MKQIVEIYKIDCPEKIRNFSIIDNTIVTDFGNGFFISDNGFLATAGHVLENRGFNYFAYYNGILYEIEIIESLYTEKDENHIDIAIGKINLKSKIDFYSPEIFREVSLYEKVTIKGYSRIINNEFDNKTNKQIIELRTFCNDLTYFYHETRVNMHNSFTVYINNTSLNGLSGSPVFNENNNIVGLFKGGLEIEKKTICQVTHIEHLKKIFENIVKKQV